jgi:transcriptional regulator with XRE-family HTH domain
MPLESVTEIAQRLALTRRASGLGQAAWCRFVGIEPTTWNNYEQGTRRISLEQALKVCTATGVSLDWIYRGLADRLPVHFATELQRLRSEDSKQNAKTSRPRPRGRGLKLLAL